MASQNGHIATVEVLIKSGADPSIADNVSEVYFVFLIALLCIMCVIL